MDREPEHDRQNSTTGADWETEFQDWEGGYEYWVEGNVAGPLATFGVSQSPCRAISACTSRDPPNGLSQSRRRCCVDGLISATAHLRSLTSTSSRASAANVTISACRPASTRGQHQRPVCSGPRKMTRGSSLHSFLAPRFHNSWHSWTIEPAGALNRPSSHVTFGQRWAIDNSGRSYVIGLLAAARPMVCSSVSHRDGGASRVLRNHLPCDPASRRGRSR